MDDAVEVDGSILEGGGQLLRNCAAFAAILGKSVHILKIRANRPKPGLRPQHLEGLKLIAEVTGGTLMNAKENSCDVWFTSGQSSSSNPHLRLLSHNTATYIADTQTAGACSLIFQVCLPVLLFRHYNSDLVIKGGTNVSFSPPIDYMKHVLIPQLNEHLGVAIDLEIARRGFMPKGGGIVHVKLQPVKTLHPIRLVERGIILRVTAKLYGVGKANQQFVGGVRENVANKLRQNGVDVEVKFASEIQELETTSKLLCGLFLYAESTTGCIFGGGCLAGRNSTPERLADSAVQDLLKQLSHGACTDEYLQDQLIIFMALANGVSEIMTGPITLHTETAIHIAHQMTGAKITITPIAGSDRNYIRCEGIGFTPKEIMP